MSDIHFKPIETLSQGKFGKVQKALDIISGKLVIIKEVNHPAQVHFLSNGGAELLKSLSHPNIQATLEINEIKNGFEIIKEFRQGETLKHLLQTNRIKKNKDRLLIIDIFIQILSALELVHKANIIHGDIKPSNILVDLSNPSSPMVTLLDLEQASYFNNPHNLIKPFSLIYSPPELILKRYNLVNQTADIFAVGISLYESLTGQIPFENSNPEIALNLQLTYPLENKGNIDNSLFTIIAKATAKQRFNLPPSRLSEQEINRILSEGIAMRYTTASNMKENLEKWRENRDTNSKTNIFTKLKSLFNKPK